MYYCTSKLTNVIIGRLIAAVFHHLGNGVAEAMVVMVVVQFFDGRLLECVLNHLAGVLLAQTLLDAFVLQMMRCIAVEEFISERVRNVLQCVAMALKTQSYRRCSFSGSRFS